MACFKAPKNGHYLEELGRCLRQGSENNWARRYYEYDGKTNSLSVTGVIGCLDDHPCVVRWQQKEIGQRLPDEKRTYVSACKGELSLIFTITSGSEKIHSQALPVDEVVEPSSYVEDLMMDNSRLQCENDELKREIEALKFQLKRHQNGYFFSSKKRRKRRR